MKKKESDQKRIARLNRELSVEFAGIMPFEFSCTVPPPSRKKKKTAKR